MCNSDFPNIQKSTAKLKDQTTTEKHARDRNRQVTGKEIKMDLKYRKVGLTSFIIIEKQLKMFHLSDRRTPETWINIPRWQLCEQGCGKRQVHKLVEGI